ncbi:adhesin [Pseudomonas sp. R5(2019)]|uniref:adhesin n=1 Tax=Pseudomonas sp. R5(2019) TaxID=2697566 RepID=UPI0014132815|nr:adhesin [Pseudomonas sp. R5(2019)]NBA98164.1 adhesin [Pseudomonas sp. R5(2019)]
MKMTLLLVSMFGSTCALAASPVIDNAIINASGQNYLGNTAINQAAGDLQQQSNSRAIAIGTHAKATTLDRQSINAQVDLLRDASSSIQGNSFTNGSGVIGVNQTSGAANQQVNAMRIGISAGPQGIDDSVLDQQNVALLKSSDATDPTPGSRQVTTSDQAFTGSRGLIQLNQSAGVGNRTANTLSVRVAD